MPRLQQKACWCNLNRLFCQPQGPMRRIYLEERWLRSSGTRSHGNQCARSPQRCAMRRARCTAAGAGLALAASARQACPPPAASSAPRSRPAYFMRLPCAHVCMCRFALCAGAYRIRHHHPREQQPVHHHGAGARLRTGGSPLVCRRVRTRPETPLTPPRYLARVYGRGAQRTSSSSCLREALRTSPGSLRRTRCAGSGQNRVPLSALPQRRGSPGWNARDRRIAVAMTAEPAY